MAETFDLSRDTILIRLVMRQAGLSSRSRTLSQEAAHKHKADADSVRGIVQKLGSDDLAPITKIVNESRSFFLANTLPWDDSGYRVTPVTRYAHVKRELTRMENSFSDAVDALLANYKNLRKDYERRVNDLAQEIPFPTLEEMKGNFDFTVMEQPIANPADLRLRHVDPSTVEELKDRMNSVMSDRLEEAQRDIIRRLAEVVERIKEQTGNAEGRLFASLITNVEEAVDVLPKLNLKNDPEINRLIDRVRTELTSIDIAVLRDNPKERAKAAKLASAILSDLNSYGKPTPRSVAKAAVAASVVAVKKKKNSYANVTI